MLLILTSLIAYLEWGGNNQAFLFKVEAQIFHRLLSDPISLLHPFVIIPLLAQVLLLINTFLKLPSKTMFYMALAGLALLLGFILLCGLITLNLKVIFSTLPFVMMAFVTFRHYKKLP